MLLIKIMNKSGCKVEPCSTVENIETRKEASLINEENQIYIIHNCGINVYLRESETHHKFSCKWSV
jgi:hypothetical protein